MKKLMNWAEKKIRKMSIWTFGLVKAVLVLLGIIVGAYISTFVRHYILYFAALFAVLYAALWCVLFKKK
ncbi:MAG: hypothetical protein NTV63_03545 [Candidatus Woesearchaeota archaeon]|nr:hypothetical protein [Candidatus Woesearchaeota archaeon]